jgi:hypothetical protein
MGRALRYLGVVALALAAWMLLGDVAGWIADSTVDHWFRSTAVLGLACLGAGLLMKLFAPVGKELKRRHCRDCGAPTLTGQDYCRDHLQARINQLRDKTRERILSGPREKGRGLSSS